TAKQRYCRNLKPDRFAPASSQGSTRSVQRVPAETLLPAPPAAGRRYRQLPAPGASLLFLQEHGAAYEALRLAPPAAGGIAYDKVGAWRQDVAHSGLPQ